MRLFGRRSLKAHEALIVATQDLSRRADVDTMGVSSEHLAEHPLTADIGERDINWAIDQARSAGWLMDDELLRADLGGNWSGLRLTHEGLEQVAELTRPLWHRLVGALVGDVRTIIVGAISGAVAGVVVVVIVDLIS